MNINKFPNINVQLSAKHMHKQYNVIYTIAMLDGFDERLPLRAAYLQIYTGIKLTVAYSSCC